jgi:hypothetical protein
MEDRIDTSGMTVHGPQPGRQAGMAAAVLEVSLGFPVSVLDFRGGWRAEVFAFSHDRLQTKMVNEGCIGRGGACLGTLPNGLAHACVTNVTNALPRDHALRRAQKHHCRTGLNNPMHQHAS